MLKKNQPAALDSADWLFGALPPPVNDSASKCAIALIRDYRVVRDFYLVVSSNDKLKGQLTEICSPNTTVDYALE
jgi:hypothetical protein